MKNILRKISWQKFEETLSATVARFPLACVGLFALATLAILGIEGVDWISDENMFRLSVSVIFMLWLSVSAQFLSESFALEDTKRGALQVLAGLMTIGYWFTLPGSLDGGPGADTFLVHVMLHVAMVVSVFFTFTLGQWKRGEYNDTPFYNFLVTAGLYLTQSVVVAGVLFLMGASILGTLDLLFDLSWVSGERYLEWWVVVGVVIAPLYFLSLVPSQMPERLMVGEKFLHFLIRYAAVPFICIYFVILYAYSLKVLLNFSQWPRGEVSWLVIWFSFFSYVVYVLSYHLKQEEWISRVRQWIPVLLLPQLAMLFYAIMLRIDQHGITVNRYLVVGFGVWIAITSIYYAYKKSEGKLVVIPASLFVAVLLATWGPWSMFSVSERSQLAKLATLLEEIEVVRNGEVTPLSKEKLEILRENASLQSSVSTVRYLCEYHGCESMNDLLGEELVSESKSDYSYQESSNLLESLGLPEYVSVRGELGGTEYYSVYTQNRIGGIDISQYRHLEYFSSRYGSLDEYGEQAYFDNSNSSINFTRNGQKVEVSLENGLARILEEHGRSGYNQEYTLEDVSFLVTKNERNYRIVVQSVSGSSDGGSITIDHADGWLMY